jgi:hypothetical protein
VRVSSGNWLILLKTSYKLLLSNIIKAGRLHHESPIITSYVLILKIVILKINLSKRILNFDSDNC